MRPIALRWILPVLTVPLVAAGPGPEPRWPSRLTVVPASATADEAEVAWYARRYRISPALARTIWTQASEHGVEPGIVFGMIAIESRFDPRAVGQRGERGLMQIRPDIARTVERRVTAEGLMRPETNLRVALVYLKREVEHFGNDWKLGLLAYQVGRGRLTRALDRGRVPRGYAGQVLAEARRPPS